MGTHPVSGLGRFGRTGGSGIHSTGSFVDCGAGAASGGAGEGAGAVGGGLLGRGAELAGPGLPAGGVVDAEELEDALADGSGLSAPVELGAVLPFSAGAGAA
ncbi:hypothetical protein [Nocardia sp. NPDC051570]|uniref:hypothetical protein n=1 Tax=Nocardia sp. NPDC051570 TaxID=3364324 RepID=UPI0037B6396B